MTEGLSAPQRWKLVVSDRDGTLLDSRSRVSPANARAVADLLRLGIGFTLATGRMDRMIRTYVRQLKIQLPVIACNGAIIRDCQTDRILWQQIMPADQGLAVIRWLAERGYDYLCYTPDEVYYPAHSLRIELFHEYNRLALAAGSEPIRLLPLEGRQEAIATGLIKILAKPDPSHSMAAIRSQVQAMPELGGVASMDDAFDIMAAGVSKGAALQRLAGLLDIRLDQVAALGDNDNDADMLAAAGLGIAMANATPPALAAGSRVTRNSHECSGLAEAIRRFIINPPA
jgi:Cof subfamily protein (haloacid dehalogenase superfamily)